MCKCNFKTEILCKTVYNVDSILFNFTKVRQQKHHIAAAVTC